MGGNSSLSKKLRFAVFIVGVVVSAAYFLFANEDWRSNPTTFTAVMRFLSLFPFITVVTLWFIEESRGDIRMIIACVSAMAIGMTLNSVAIIANDGRMPIAPSLMAAGFPKYYVNGGNMLWLGDSLWMGNSIGDCFCYVAMIILVYLSIKKTVDTIRMVEKR